MSIVAQQKQMSNHEVTGKMNGEGNSSRTQRVLSNDHVYDLTPISVEVNSIGYYQFISLQLDDAITFQTVLNLQLELWTICAK